MLLQLFLYFGPTHLIDTTVLCPALSLLAYFQVMATVLNLIPLPPLDGEHVNSTNKCSDRGITEVAVLSC